MRTMGRTVQGTVGKVGNDTRGACSTRAQSNWLLLCVSELSALTGTFVMAHTPLID